MSDITWDEKDTLTWRKFLEQDSTGVKVIAYLSQLRPNLTTKDHLTAPEPFQAAALSAYRAEGWEDCVEQLKAMSAKDKNTLKPL